MTTTGRPPVVGRPRFRRQTSRALRPSAVSNCLSKRWIDQLPVSVVAKVLMRRPSACCRTCCPSQIRASACQPALISGPELEEGLLRPACRPLSRPLVAAQNELPLSAPERCLLHRRTTVRTSLPPAWHRRPLSDPFSVVVQTVHLTRRLTRYQTFAQIRAHRFWVARCGIAEAAATRRVDHQPRSGRHGLHALAVQPLA